MSRRRGAYEICRGTNLERWLSTSTHQNVEDHGDYFHVTLSTEGGHVTGDVDKFSTKTRGIHVKIYNYDENGNIKGPGQFDFREPLSFPDEF